MKNCSERVAWLHTWSSSEISFSCRKQQPRDQNWKLRFRLQHSEERFKPWLRNKLFYSSWSIPGKRGIFLSERKTNIRIKFFLWQNNDVSSNFNLDFIEIIQLMSKNIWCKNVKVSCSFFAWSVSFLIYYKVQTVSFSFQFFRSCQMLEPKLNIRKKDVFVLHRRENFELKFDKSPPSP